MSTFCLIAFIPCIILVVLLFVELRKFIVVNKKFKIVKRSWERLQKRKSATRERDGFVESIPPPPPDYHDSHPAPSPVFIDYDERDISYSRTRQRRAKPLRTRRRADPEYDSSYYDDHARDHLYDEESGYRDELEPEYDS